MKVNNIAIFFGGQSTEHDISILSALQVLNAINKQKYNIFPIYISKSGKWFYSESFTCLENLRNFNEKKYKEVFIKPADNILYYTKGFFKKVAGIDCALVVMHGKNGEDGVLQGVLEMSNIPYTSSGVTSLAVTLDKSKMKEVFLSNNFPIVKHKVITSIEQSSKIELSYPVVVKPNCLGSSIGISLCKNKKELISALDVAFKFDKKVIIEECVKNLIEYNCAAYGFGDKVVVSKIERPLTNSEILSFEEKYVSKGKSKARSKREIPAKIEIGLKTQIENLTAKAFKCFDCAGVIRCDFLYDGENLFINEVNSIPGSLAYYLFDKPFSNLIDNLIEIAVLKQEEKGKVLSSFESSVL